jgi:hypothetical protein
MGARARTHTHIEMLAYVILDAIYKTFEYFFVGSYTNITTEMKSFREDTSSTLLGDTA